MWDVTVLMSLPFCFLLRDKYILCKSYTTVSLSVRRENLQAFASGLSIVLVDRP